ncbi:hypothetical protein AB0I22_38090 [Streptomyces sp. NPDC050610]|uniref:hypothetical protein n=1 Tax=Streptomyces sp. NPDC050610 TaxID=3157097 RepID=UPI00342F6C48
MDTDLDDAHTDHTQPCTRPAPAGCAESEDDWRRRLQHETPGGHLLAHNAMTQTLTSGRPIRLLHTTTALDAIRASGQLYASSGCLLAALYCTPLTETPAGLRPHNLGAYLLETKPHTQTLMIEITPTTPAPAKGIDYLRLGRVHLNTYLDHRNFLTETEDLQLRGRTLHQIREAAPFLDLALANASGRRTTPDTFVDRLAATVPDLPFLGYVYFEVLSEYLMLHSASTETTACAQAGEMNNRLYKRLAFSAVRGMDKLFDLSRFHPGHQRLHDVIAGIERSLAPGAAPYTRDRLSHLLTTLALNPDQDAATFTFRDQDFDSLVRTAPSLLGQTLFREMSLLQRYPQLYLVFEQAKALRAWTYWNHHQIATPFNGFLPKGEIGVNPAFPALCTVWLTETYERGLIHPSHELDVTFAPRMADLGLTAMRRDTTGKAAGHPTAA